jgi:hypothetical protein
MSDLNHDPETGEVIEAPRGPRVHHKDSLATYKLLESKRELFRRNLSNDERRVAADLATTHEMERDDARSRGVAESKWVAAALFSTDAVTRLAREEEMEWRKKIAGADAAKSEALRMIELRAAANGFRWEESETHEYADDFEHEIFTIRMDTMTETFRRRMNEFESKAAEERRQQKLFSDDR